jgi:streptogramin lyase
MNGRIRIRPIPFARETQTAVGPQSRLYYGWTDSLRIAAQAPDGTSEAVASVPTEPIPVQEAERDSALTNLDGDMKGMLASALPDTKPAFTQLLVDDKERLWVRRPTNATVPKHRWWILNPASKTIHEVQVPSEVNLEVVQNGMAYGTTETEMGAPAVIRYRIGSSS